MYKKRYNIIMILYYLLLFVASFLFNEMVQFDFIDLIILIFVISGGFGLILNWVFAVKIVNILNEECDPEKYLFEYDKFYRPDKSNINYPLHCLNKYAGLCEAGRYDEARRIINPVSLQEIGKKVKDVLLYYINTLHLNIIDENFEEAQENLEEIQKHIDGISGQRLSEKKRTLFINSIDSSKAEMLRKQENLTGSRELLNELLQGDMSKRATLHCVFTLAQIDIAEQKYDDAKIALERIIAEGNKLYIVALAKEELEKIEKSTVNADAY